jgi:uncharacterized protein (DUF302 family)
MAELPDNGMIHLSSPHSVPETLDRLKALVQKRGLTIFAEIDHSGEAAKVGLTMQEAKLLIFGSPKSGTPVMITSPTVALDLPLKGLIWQDAKGGVWLTYNSPEYLQQRHQIPSELVPNIAGVRAIFEEVVR